VHALITSKKLGAGVMNVAIPSEEFVFTNGEKHDMADWNLLLYAIALK